MKMLVFILFFPLLALSQKDTFLIMEMYYKDKDTLILADIEEIEILHFRNREDERYFRRLQYKTLKVYPYAKLAAQQLDSIQTQLELIPKKRKRKAYVKATEQWIKEDLAPELKKLSRWEGRILSKLIYRETNISTYQIVKDLKGGFYAFFWQGMAKLYDNNLKTPYQPQSVEEDKWIEYIIVDANKKGIIK
tara:strand:- start:4189 stop:4764 length:576 start_codon:yes stop_codon:yes gene_type:complete